MQKLKINLDENYTSYLIVCTAEEYNAQFTQEQLADLNIYKMYNNNNIQYLYSVEQYNSNNELIAHSDNCCCILNDGSFAVAHWWQRKLHTVTHAEFIQELLVLEEC